jgi:hypothetical protein
MASAINLLSYLKTPVVAVLVGPYGGHQQSFTIHEGLLTDRSQFFANALKPGRFKEGIKRLVPLPDDAPEVFAIYAQILYLPDFLVDVDDLRGAECEQPYIGLCKLYVLVEKLMDDTTKAVVLKALERLTAVFGVPVRGTRIIYEATLEDDPTRKMVVKGFTEHDTEPPSAPFATPTPGIQISSAISHSRHLSSASCRRRSRR